MTGPEPAAAGAAFAKRLERLDESLRVTAEQETAAFRVQVMLERGTIDGGYIATFLDLPGCVSQGETEADALSNLTDAIGGVLMQENERLRAELDRVRAFSCEHGSFLPTHYDEAYKLGLVKHPPESFKRYQ